MEGQFLDCVSLRVLTVSGLCFHRDRRSAGSCSKAVSPDLITPDMTLLCTGVGKGLHVFVISGLGAVGVFARSEPLP